MIFAGVDVGSMSAEAVLMKDDEILAASVIVVKPNPVESATEAMAVALAEAGLSLEQIDYCVSTGYGREKIPFSDHNVSEISCHGKGAFWADPSIGTIVDIGGQDCKVIQIDAEGDLKDFIMNDKCAAGTGRFLEGIAKSFNVQVADLGQMALNGSDPVPINSICTIFTQFDAMCFLADGRSREDIALGVAEALAQRVNKLAGQVGISGKVCMSGGVAKNQAVVKAMEKVIGHPIQPLRVDSQVVGALGAAIYAAERYLKFDEVIENNCLDKAC
ncbi:MAG: acyl-CoA dehydratase activase [Desulfuromonadales bacterium]|nr:acyl-CoA dehydratase activase [Desulfuromonadales bacterium]